MAESKTLRSRLLEWGVATLKYPLSNIRNWNERVEATGKGNLVKVSREPVLKHTRSVSDKVFEVWRSPGRFTKNPDLIRVASGRMLLIYSDTDGHFSRENQILTLLASDDDGRTWHKHREVGP